MAIGRRGFLKALGKGAAVGAAMATPAAYAGGLDIGTGEDKTALHFTCPMCSQSVVAVVPKNKGEIVNVSCGCELGYQLRWNGGSFSVYREGDTVLTLDQEQEQQVAHASDPLRYAGGLKPQDRLRTALELRKHGDISRDELLQVVDRGIKDQ